MEPKVDTYLTEGCGRCPLGGTLQCKVHPWREALMQLRSIVLDCGLTETLKWGVPCYTYSRSGVVHNIVIISAFKEYCALSFFKGALLKDQGKMLDKPGQHTQAARLIKFAHVREIIDKEQELKAYIHEAIEVEKAGLKVTFKKKPEPIPVELQKELDADPMLKASFEALTPGRQRGYILYIAAAKQSKTREARVKKYIPKILSGRGFHD